MLMSCLTMSTSLYLFKNNTNDHHHHHRVPFLVASLFFLFRQRHKILRSLSEHRNDLICISNLRISFQTARILFFFSSSHLRHVVLDVASLDIVLNYESIRLISVYFTEIIISPNPLNLFLFKKNKPKNWSRAEWKWCDLNTLKNLMS